MKYDNEIQRLSDIYDQIVAADKQLSAISNAFTETSFLGPFGLPDRERSEMQWLSRDIQNASRVLDNTNERIRLIIQTLNQEAI